MKREEAPGPSEVSFELIAAIGIVGIQVIAEMCHTVLDGFGMPAQWALSVVVLILKGKGDIRSCYGAVKLFEHCMKVVKRVFEKSLYRIVAVNEMQFGFMPERGTIDAVFILRRMQEEHYARGKKLLLCFVDLEKAFDRVPWNVY